MPSLGSYIRHLREKELTLHKLFLRVEKRVSKTKKPDNDIMRKEKLQAIITHGYLLS